MKKVILNMKEQYKYETIKSCYHKQLTKQGAATRLGITIQQVNRLLCQYELNGKESFRHKNKGRVSNKRISQETRNKIIELYLTKYDGSNSLHFSELIQEHENIKVSDTFIRILLHENDIYPPRTWKKTIKRARTQKRKMSKVTSKDNVEVQNYEVEVQTIHPSKERKKYFGEEVQIDASVHNWFGTTKTHLHAAIDNSTGNILALYFDEQETLKGYYNIYAQILKKFGIPYEFSTDRRTVFEYKKKAPHSNIECDTYTQFAYACNYFGTNIKTSSVPQAKGQVERLFGTLQSRLITELKIRGIQSINAANEFLPEFIKRYNSKFALQVNYTTSVFENVNNKKEIYNILSVRAPRIINRGSCIKFESRTFYPAIDGVRKYFDHRTKALVFKTLDGELYVTIGDEIYSMIELSENKSHSTEFDEIKRKKRKKKIYRPPMSHPWKQASFDKFVAKQKHLELDTNKHMYH